MPTEKPHGDDPTDRDELITHVQAIEQRIVAFAAHQESQIDELRQLIDQVQLEQRQAEAEIALYGEQAAVRANEALARAEEALRRLEALAPEAGTMELPAQLFAAGDAPASPGRDVTQHLTAVAAQQTSQIDELRQLIDQVQLDQHHVEAEVRAGAEQATARADKALARADETLQRLETLAAQAGTAELPTHPSADEDALIGSVRDVEQRVAAVAAQQESRLEELRQLIDQAQLEQRHVEAEVRTRAEQAATRADEALAHADDTLRRLETLAAATQAPQAHTTELLDRLSADRDALTASVRDVEQRVAAVAAQQESRLEELRQLIDQAQLEQRHVEAEVRTRAEQAATRADEALAHADDTLRRLETLAAAAQAPQAHTTELLDRLSADRDALTASVRDVEQRLAALAAPQEASTGSSRNEIEAVRSVEPQESSIPADPGSLATGLRMVNEQLQALASWLMLTAPGILLALVLLSLGLIATPWLTSFVQVAPGVRSTAVALLLAHGVATVLVARRGRWWPAAVAFMAVLALDAFCAGLLLGADLQMGSPAIAICLAVLALSLMAGGWPVGLGSVLALCAGIGTAMSRGLTPLLLSPVMWLPTTLSVETSFTNAPAPAVTAPAFLTTLSVETLYGGSPVVFGSSVPLFMPVLAIMLLVISIGAGLNLLRARKARAAVAATIVAAHRCMVRG